MISSVVARGFQHPIGLQAAALAGLLCACARVGPDRERPAPELFVESSKSPEGGSILLRCPPDHEYGCKAVFRIPHASPCAEVFVLSWGVARELVATETELLYVSQDIRSTLVAYPVRAAGPTARASALRTLDTAGGSVRALARAGDRLVVLRENDILVAPLDGGPRRTLASMTSSYFVHTDGHSVVWSETGSQRSSGQIMQVPIDGGTPRVLADAGCSPRDVAIDESGVYWLCSGKSFDEAGGQVRMLATDATQPQTLADGQLAPRVLATDVDAVYWVDDGRHGRTLRKVSKRGREVIDLMPQTRRWGNRSNVDAIQIFGDRVYFNAGDAVWAVTVDGSAPTRLAWIETEDSDVATFAVGDDAIYISADIRSPHEPVDFED